MKNLLSIIIPSYKSSKKILKHLRELPKNIKVIIIENSQDDKLKKNIKIKYKNVKVILQKNIGYGNAINLGSLFVKTKFFFVMNPDTVIYKDTLRLLLKGCKKINKFGAVSPNYRENKRKKHKRIIEEKKTLTGGAMLFDTKMFKKIGGFDKNIFLYYEDNDYFTKCRKMGIKLYTINNSYHFHKKKSSGSATFKTKKEMEYANFLAGWHGQWSKFYYHKKYDGYLKAFILCMPNLITNILQLIINLPIKYNKSKYIYFKIEGLMASIIGLSSYKRSNFD